MRAAVVLAILVMVMTTAGCTGGETPEPEVTAATTTPQPLVTPTPKLPTAVSTPTATPNIEATVQAQVPADPTRVAPTPAPSRTLPVNPVTNAAVTPTRPGICGRSPAIQEAILKTIGAPYCRTITEDELYRIQCFKSGPEHSCGSTTDYTEWKTHGPKSGDFAGLSNLSYVEIEGPFDIPAGTFTGSSIGTLVLDVDAIESGAFEDATVQALRITANQALPKNTLPTSVVYLELRIVTPPNALRGDELEGLANLESLTLALHAYETDEEFQKAVETLDFWDPGNEYWKPENIIFSVPSDIFTTNTSLRSVLLYAGNRLRGSGGPRSAIVSVDRSAFSNLPQLEGLSLRYLQVRDHISGTPPLVLNPGSPLHRHLNSEDGTWNSWSYGETLNASTPE